MTSIKKNSRFIVTKACKVAVNGVTRDYKPPLNLIEGQEIIFVESEPVKIGSFKTNLLYCIDTISLKSFSIDEGDFWHYFKSKMPTYNKIWNNLNI